MPASTAIKAMPCSNENDAEIAGRSDRDCERKFGARRIVAENLLSPLGRRETQYFVNRAAYGRLRSAQPPLVINYPFIIAQCLAIEPADASKSTLSAPLSLPDLMVLTNCSASLYPPRGMRPQKSLHRKLMGV